MIAVEIHNQTDVDLIDASALTPEERAEFDYLNWPAIDAGRDSATFFRFMDQLYSLDQFTRFSSPESGWHGHHADSAFSGIVVRFIPDDSEGLIVARALF